MRPTGTPFTSTVKLSWPSSWIVYVVASRVTDLFGTSAMAAGVVMRRYLPRIPVGSRARRPPSWACAEATLRYLFASTIREATPDDAPALRPGALPCARCLLLILRGSRSGRRQRLRRAARGRRRGRWLGVHPAPAAPR